MITALDGISHGRHGERKDQGPGWCRDETVAGLPGIAMYCTSSLRVVTRIETASPLK